LTSFNFDMTNEKGRRDKNKRDVSLALLGAADACVYVCMSAPRFSWCGEGVVAVLREARIVR
jgi:hypothetical protein